MAYFILPISQTKRYYSMSFNLVKSAVWIDGWNLLEASSLSIISDCSESGITRRSFPHFFFVIDHDDSVMQACPPFVTLLWVCDWTGICNISSSLVLHQSFQYNASAFFFVDRWEISEEDWHSFSEINFSFEFILSVRRRPTWVVFTRSSGKQSSCMFAWKIKFRELQINLWLLALIRKFIGNS